MNKITWSLCTFFIVFSVCKAQRVEIPKAYAFKSNVNMSEEHNFNTIQIPLSSIDTSGQIEASDTINHYIYLAELESNKGNYRKVVLLLLPNGNYNLNKPILLKSYVHLIGSSAANCKLLCHTGEGKPCIALSPTNAALSLNPYQSLDIFNNITQNPSENISFPVFNIAAKDTFLFAALVRTDDSIFISSSWAKNKIQEPFIIDTRDLETTGSSFNVNKRDVKILHMRNERFGYSGGFRNLLDYNTANTKLNFYNYITNAGLKCITIIRMDTTVSQTSNILMQNAVSCTIRGVQSEGCNFSHITLENSLGNTIKRNHLHQGNGYGGGGKAYGITIHQGSSSNTVTDNVLHHLRHSILLQSGANKNIILANYSFDPYWEQGAFPADAAGDMVLHGNYPFGNLFELNVAQQIVIDDSHGKNGPHNIFHRNWLQNYGLLMSAANGSDSQVFTGNEISSAAFLKGLYILQDKGHFEYGNKVRNNIFPPNTNNPLVSSIAHNSLNYYYLRRLVLPIPATFINIDSMPFGEPYNQTNKTIPALIREQNIPDCETQDDYDVFLSTKTLKEPAAKIIAYPNPSQGKVNILESGFLVLYDMQGKILFAKEVVTGAILEIPFKGVLIGRLKQESQVIIQKLIVLY